LNIKRKGKRMGRVKSSPLIYTISYKLEPMGNEGALSACDLLLSSVQRSLLREGADIQ
jgi:hypothetical protein